jgi:nucleotide-binding universal stress UspA family protein
MKLIFVPVSNRSECALALDTAFKLGKQLDASILGCHIRAHNSSDVLLPDDLISEEELNIIKVEDKLRKKAHKKSTHAKNLFRTFAENHDYQFAKRTSPNPSALWTKKVGSSDKVISILGPVSDLLIVSRPIQENGKGKKAKRIMMAALLNSSKPVLILPQSEIQSVGKTISIAWDQSPAAALAVNAALPLLCKAETVNIITTKSESKPGPNAKQLKTYLRCWGIKSKHIVCKEKTDSQALIQGYKQTNSDLLVMGGYSHSQLRERLFGGVTQYMLNDADIPVFMLHS